MQFIREPERFTGRKLVRDAVIASLGFGYAVWAMYATGSESIAKGYILLMLGIPVYLWMRRRRQMDRIPIRTEHVEPPVLVDETPVVVPDTPASIAP
jgi:APA family basic amino acid/polyamine antiporter